MSMLKSNAEEKQNGKVVYNAGIVKGISEGEISVYSTIIYAMPVAVAVLGVVMFIKRKYL